MASFEPLATGFKDKFDVMLHSGSADPEGSTTAAEAEDDVKLEVRGQDIWKRNALVYRGEEIVMQARFVNLLTCYVPFKSNEWDVYVAEGMDLSLAAAIMAYLAASLYDSADFGIMNRMIGGGKGTNDKRSSLNKHVMMGATAGAAAGSGGGSC